MSSSQLTKSYFSEGLKPPTRYSILQHSTVLYSVREETLCFFPSWNCRHTHVQNAEFWKAMLARLHKIAIGRSSVIQTSLSWFSWIFTSKNAPSAGYQPVRSVQKGLDHEPNTWMITCLKLVDGESIGFWNPFNHVEAHSLNRWKTSSSHEALCLAQRLNWEVHLDMFERFLWGPWRHGFFKHFFVCENNAWTVDSFKQLKQQPGPSRSVVIGPRNLTLPSWIPSWSPVQLQVGISWS